MLIRFGLVAAALLMLALAPASAQTFPNRTIHIVVAYAPGGTGDIVARLISVPLAEALGQNIVIENRAGATGAIGTQAVASAPPDGHTLLMGQTGEIAINQHWIKGLTYNAEKDLCPSRLPRWCRWRSSSRPRRPIRRWRNWPRRWRRRNR